MGVEELRKEILEEAERKVKEILSEAKAEAEKILREAEERVAEIRRAKEDEARKRMEEKLRSELSLARIEGKKLIVNTRWELVDEVFRRAWERVESYVGSDEYYSDFLPRMVALGVSRIGFDEVKLHMNEADVGRVRGMLRRFAKEVSRHVGRDVKLSISNNPLRITGGVVVSDPDENVFFNASFDALFNRAREELAPDVFEVLFGGG